MKDKYKLIDLFCGAGGMTLGFVDKRYSGLFESIFAIDNERAAVDTYNLNFGNDDHCIHADIEEWVKENTVPAADVVIGGPPCQGFSLLNKKRQGDHRRALWEPYLDIVERSGASIFVMENVSGLLKSPEFDDICCRAREMGFELLQPEVLNTADYGVPQTRKRTIAIGVKVSEFDLSSLEPFPPAPTHSAPGKDTGLPNWVTTKEAIGDLPRETKGTEIRKNDPAPLNLHFGRNPTEMSKERYKVIPPGGNRFDLQKHRPDITPNCWIKKKSGGTDLFGRLWWDRPSVTIRTEFFKPEKGRYLHPSADRPISHREATRLMSFPDSFEFSGTKIEIAKQIGNAVPPTFAGAIASFTANLLSKRMMGKSKKVA
ncbi:DNA cytosine methyltransferase [Psychromonas aquimarina]|uniref:DNA cytosine methyltransferase n=1 Tax=Psychromonas aquimarina TaxID=444919 RepID=UPI0004248106|nr:DNA cytosine methyltransferase [Psychromonas aquimarina]